MFGGDGICAGSINISGTISGDITGGTGTHAGHGIETVILTINDGAEVNAEDIRGDVTVTGALFNTEMCGIG